VTRAVDREIGDVERRLREKGFPRLQMSLIVVLAGVGAFLVSASLLWAGLDRMPLRYFLAGAGGYGIFLILIRVWLAHQRGRLSLNPDFPTGPSSLENSDVPTPPDGTGVPRLGDLANLGGDWPIALGVTLLVVGLLAIVSVVYASPVLFAEVLLDAAVAGAVYRRTRGRDRAHWLRGVVRRTWIPAALVCGLVAFGAFLLQTAVPEARSLGDVIRVWR
jgi:hypothetical protein